MDDPQVKPQMSLGAKLQSVKRHVLYLTLFGVVSLSLILSHLFSIQVPSQPQEYTKEAYKLIRNLHEGDTIVIDTGATNASRGENGGQMEALLRMCMREKVKFVMYSYVEPQCIEVARAMIANINLERSKANPPEPAYKEWDDFVILGFFPDGATMLQTAAANIRDAWGNKKAKDPSGAERSVFESPVLQNIKKIEDIKVYVGISPTNIMATIVGRVGKRVPIISMIAGVMFPEQFNYYKSGQLAGLLNGLVGAVEMENLMQNGIDSQGVAGGKAEGPPIAAPFPGEINLSRGNSYYFAFCCAISLLMLTIVVGNVGMYLERKRKN
ncbi:MAG: hypothetical protein P4L46_25165 [Fimbriimonas sp.]|nr:hypothetical protein [Fimbriimonas sp.]